MSQHAGKARSDASLARGSWRALADCLGSPKRLQAQGSSYVPCLWHSSSRCSTRSCAGRPAVPLHEANMLCIPRSTARAATRGEPSGIAKGAAQLALRACHALELHSCVDQARHPPPSNEAVIAALSLNMLSCGCELPPLRWPVLSQAVQLLTCMPVDGDGGCQAPSSSTESGSAICGGALSAPPADAATAAE